MSPRGGVIPQTRVANAVREQTRRARHGEHRSGQACGDVKRTQPRCDRWSYRRGGQQDAGEHEQIEAEMKRVGDEPEAAV